MSLFGEARIAGHPGKSIHVYEEKRRTAAPTPGTEEKELHKFAQSKENFFKSDTNADLQTKKVIQQASHVLAPLTLTFS